MWKAQTFEIGSVLAKRIHFKGHIQTESLAAIMAAASAFVYVPYFEGFGMPLAEAMATQTPIIAGDKSCLPEIAADAALYVDPFDVEAIAKAMEQLKNDVALQTQLVESITHVRTVKEFGIEEFSNLKTENKFVKLLFTSFKSGLNSVFAGTSSHFLASIFTVILLQLPNFILFSSLC